MTVVKNTFTQPSKAHNIVPEALYPRDGFITIDGKVVPVFLGHPKATCDHCEFPFANERRHPRDPERPDLVVICGNHRMRLVDGKLN